MAFGAKGDVDGQAAQHLPYAEGAQRLGAGEGIRTLISASRDCQPSRDPAVTTQACAGSRIPLHLSPSCHIPRRVAATRQREWRENGFQIRRAGRSGRPVAGLASVPSCVGADLVPAAEVELDKSTPPRSVARLVTRPSGDGRPNSTRSTLGRAGDRHRPGARAAALELDQTRAASSTAQAMAAALASTRHARARPGARRELDRRTWHKCGTNQSSERSDARPPLNSQVFPKFTVTCRLRVTGCSSLYSDTGSRTDERLTWVRGRKSQLLVVRKCPDCI